MRRFLLLLGWPRKNSMKSYRTILSVLFVIILVLFSTWGFLMYETKKAAAELAQTETTVEMQSQALTTRVVLKKQLDETQQARIKLTSYFVSEEALVSFIEQLEALGRETGARVEVVGATNATTLSLEIRIRGSFTAVFRTIELIEKIPYALTIERASINTGSDTKEAWSANLTINLSSLNSNE